MKLDTAPQCEAAARNHLWPTMVVRAVRAVGVLELFFVRWSVSGGLFGSQLECEDALNGSNALAMRRFPSGARSACKVLLCEAGSSVLHGPLVDKHKIT